MNEYNITPPLDRPNNEHAKHVDPETNQVNNQPANVRKNETLIIGLGIIVKASTTPNTIKRYINKAQATNRL